MIDDSAPASPEVSPNPTVGTVNPPGLNNYNFIDPAESNYSKMIIHVNHPGYADLINSYDSKLPMFDVLTKNKNRQGYRILGLYGLLTIQKNESEFQMFDRKSWNLCLPSLCTIVIDNQFNGGHHE